MDINWDTYRNFTEEGRFIAMDLGGTNLRVMLMDITPGEELKTEQFNTRIPNWAMRGTGEQASLFSSDISFI